MSILATFNYELNTDKLTGQTVLLVLRVTRYLRGERHQHGHPKSGSMNPASRSAPSVRQSDPGKKQSHHPAGVS